jgi:transcriptional regulator with XRE-family HTH domain
MSKGPKSPVSPLSRAVSGEVRALRARKKLSIGQVASMSGMKAGRLGYLLRDEAVWTLTELEQVSEALGVPALDLLRLAESTLREHPERYVGGLTQDDVALAADEHYIDGEDTEVDHGA